MKRKEIKNKNLMSALTIGISAMMALSTPITAYASNTTEGGEGAPEPAPQEPTTEQTATQESAPAPEPVTEEAQQQAEVVQEATTEAVDSAVNEATEAAQTILEGNEEAGIEAVTPGEAGVITDQAIDELTQAAKEITQDTTDSEGNVTDPSAVSSLNEATGAVEEAKTELKEANDNNYQADLAAGAIEEHGEKALEDGVQATQTAEAIGQDAADAQQKAEELVDAINNASTVKEAEQAFKDLEEAVSTAETSIADKKAYYDRLMDNYNKALEELKKAEAALDVYEKAYSKNLDDALEKAQAAEEDIAAAQAKIDNLSQALDHVEGELAEEANQAAEAAQAFDNVTESNWNIQRNLMMSTVENYIIPQLEQKDITDVTWERVVGFDRQDNNYCKITYKVDGETVTRYFNYDRLNRYISDNRYDSLGGSWGIAIYEKTQDEIDADNFLREIYGQENFYIKTHYADNPDRVDGNANKELKERTNLGEFDVFTYVDDNGNKVMLTRPMLKAEIDAGRIIENDNKYATADGKEVKQIVQNSNSLIHGGDAYLLANTNDVTNKYKNNILKALELNHSKQEAQQIYSAMVEDNKAYQAYLTEARAYIGEDGEVTHVLAEKYARYEVAVDKAQDAVDKAQDEADKLSDAITELQETKKSRKVLATDVLKVDDIATYFGIEVSPERAQELNNMTVQEALEVLQEYLDAANDKVEQAQNSLNDLKDGLEAAKSDLEAAKKRLAPAGGGGGNEGGGSSGGGATTGTETAETVTVAYDASAAGAGAGGAVVEAAEDGRAGIAQAGGAGGAVQTGGGAQEEAGLEEAEIPEEGVALTAAPGTTEKKAQAIANIGDEETPQSSKPVTKEKLNWWWALVILLLGERGRELYAKYKKET